MADDRRDSISDTPGGEHPQQGGEREQQPFLVVGVGVSAGGLEAISAFLRPVPADTRMAFVVVTHQEVGRESLLPELLGRETPIPVVETVDGVEVEPGHVYVGAPGAGVVIRDGRLYHLGDEAGESRHMPVDAFFRSLARDCRERAVAVVLSGSGSDGALGVREVRGESGLVLVQDPETAIHGSMPRTAIDSGSAHHVLPPAGMVELLSGYGKVRRSESPDRVDLIPGSTLTTIIDAVHARTGRDFSHYKETTLQRRVSHRMAIQQIGRPEHYLKFLLANPQELELLFRDLLIGVTSFFRDPVAWGALGEAAAEHLITDRRADDPLRVWVPGCSTGEEAYTLAMVLRERIDEAECRIRVSIFATDLDENGVATARYGLYPSGIRADVGDDRLDHFFHPVNGSFQVRRHLRDMLVFAPHDLLSDPPFSRLDLISCRNVLIYLRQDMQRRVLRLLHYSLKPGGLLFLGTSESVGETSTLFEALDKSHKIYRRKESGDIHHPDLPLRPSLSTSRETLTSARGGISQLSEGRTADLVEEALARLFVPVAAVVNDRGEVFYLHGDTGKVLQPTRGRPRNSLLAMAREGLEPALGSALREAVSTGGPVVRRGVRVRANGGRLMVELEVRRLDGPPPLRGLFLVVLRPVSEAAIDAPASEEPSGVQTSADRMSQLEQDLEFTKESLQSTVEELETSNEELRSSNEELQSANEELQSTNEELEASKEEMQSLNEELTTVNMELQSKVEELSRANDDMVNLLDSTDIATLFLDERLRIKRFSERATEVIRLIATDVGRHLGDLTTELEHGGLVEDCTQVLRTLKDLEREVEAADGRWFQLKIMPYRTLEGEVDGVVLTFVDISRIRQAEQVARQHAEQSMAILDTMLTIDAGPRAVLDNELRVVKASGGFARVFGLADGDGASGDLAGRLLVDGRDGEWDLPELKDFLSDTLVTDGVGRGPERSATVPGPRGTRLAIAARRLQLPGRDQPYVVIGLEPVEGETPADG